MEQRYSAGEISDIGCRLPHLDPRRRRRRYTVISENAATVRLPVRVHYPAVGQQMPQTTDKPYAAKFTFRVEFADSQRAKAI